MTRQEEITPWDHKYHPLKSIKRVEVGISSREPISFQQYKDIMHFKAPSSRKVLLIK